MLDVGNKAILVLKVFLCVVVMRVTSTWIRRAHLTIFTALFRMTLSLSLHGIKIRSASILLDLLRSRHVRLLSLSIITWMNIAAELVQSCRAVISGASERMSPIAEDDVILPTRREGDDAIM